MNIVHNTKKIRTRKTHYCLGCLRDFQAYTHMFRQVCVEDGEIYTVYWCETCDELQAYLEPDIDNLWQEGYVYNEMNQDGFKGTPEEYLLFLIEEKNKSLRQNT